MKYRIVIQGGLLRQDLTPVSEGSVSVCRRREVPLTRVGRNQRSLALSLTHTHSKIHNTQRTHTKQDTSQLNPEAHALKAEGVKFPSLEWDEINFAARDLLVRVLPPHPSHYTLYPTLYTLHPSPYTLHPQEPS